jgi:WD40 repeat protein
VPQRTNIDLSKTLIGAVMIFCLIAPITISAEEDLHVIQRINAHGDELLCLSMSPNQQFIFVGSRKGNILVWSRVENKLVKSLNQGNPVYSIIPSDDGRYILAGGGIKESASTKGIVRKWDIQKGTYQEWKTADGGCISHLAADHHSKLAAAITFTKTLTVWTLSSGKRVTTANLEGTPLSVAIIGKKILYTTVPAKCEDALAKGEEPEASSCSSSIWIRTVDDGKKASSSLNPLADGQMWGKLWASPDGKWLAASCYDFIKGQWRIVILDAASGKERIRIDGEAAAWSSTSCLLVFGSSEPTKKVLFDGNGMPKIEEAMRASQFHGAGEPANLTGQAVSADGLFAWGAFQKRGALAEWNLKEKKAKLLIDSPGFLFGLAVLDKPAAPRLLITGGDDKSVRIWNLENFAMINEFQVSSGVPQGVALVADGKKAIFSYSTDKAPTQIDLRDLATQSSRSLISVPQPFAAVHAAEGGFVYNQENIIKLASFDPFLIIREFVLEKPVHQFAISANGQWLAACDDAGSLYRFEIITGRMVRCQKLKIKDLSRITVTNDGNAVYTTEWSANLRRWNIKMDTIDELGSIRGQVSSMRLSTDERQLAIGGNHCDIGIYDAETGKQLYYGQTPDADFYITGVWLNGSRLILTTDTGLLIDSRLK